MTNFYVEPEHGTYQRYFNGGLHRKGTGTKRPEKTQLDGFICILVVLSLLMKGAFY